MSKFNENNAAITEKTYEGGNAYRKNVVEDYMNFLFSSYLGNKFYEDSDDQIDRFISLVQSVGEEFGWEFVAKTAVFARNELGMRSVSDLTAAILNSKKFDGKRAFFRNYYHRLDGVGEVFAAIDMLGEKRSHAMIRGTSDYISSLGDSQISKYKMMNKKYNLYDIVNLTHATSPSINRLKNNTLEISDTWEVVISRSESKDEREQEWKRLVEECKLGYLALIRNLNNILSCENINSVWVIKYLVPQITDKIAIEKSLVFPYQIYCAYKNLKVRNLNVISALDNAFKISVKNMPKLDGDSVILLDVSGSMDSTISDHSDMTIKEVGAVYATALYLTGKCDFVKFGDYAKACKFNRLDSAFEIISSMEKNDHCGFGTNIGPAYELLNKHYNRIFLISDMQIMDNSRLSWIWISGANGTRCYKDYCNEYGSCHLYSFDLGNYCCQTDNPNNPNVHLLTALNDTVFKMLQYIEDGKSLISYIDSHCSYM